MMSHFYSKQVHLAMCRTITPKHTKGLFVCVSDEYTRSLLRIIVELVLEEGAAIGMPLLK